jgi:hypothetical protein
VPYNTVIFQNGRKIPTIGIELDYRKSSVPSIFRTEPLVGDSGEGIGAQERLCLHVRDVDVSARA